MPFSIPTLRFARYRRAACLVAGRLLATPFLLMGCATLPPAPVPAPARPSQGLVVLDIDGTLTADVISMDDVRPGAADVLSAYVAKGYGLVYITARVPLAQAGLPEWLARAGFLSAPLHVAQSSGERADPAAFKAALLAKYAARGWRLAWAYGDSSSDFAAYASAGLAPRQVFALRRRGDRACQPGAWAACLDDWVAHRIFVAGLPDDR